MDHIDLYCERTDAGLWSEPLNAITNLAFIAAAVVLWRQARKQGADCAELRFALCLIAAIGVGSGLFHIFANPLTIILDELPIAFAVVFVIWLYLRRMTAMNSIPIAALLAAAVLAAVEGGRYHDILNGSLMYAPVLVLVGALGIFHLRVQAHEPYSLIYAASAFSLALVFRTVDLTACAAFPLGTHFLWHLLDALALYLAVRALIANWPKSTVTP